jgi:hypothetical protein
MPHPEKAFLPNNFVEALFKVMKQTDYISMPSQSNQQTMKKVYDDWKSSSKPQRNIDPSLLAFQENQRFLSINRRMDLRLFI